MSQGVGRGTTAERRRFATLVAYDGSFLTLCPVVIAVRDRAALFSRSGVAPTDGATAAADRVGLPAVAPGKRGGVFSLCPNGIRFSWSRGSLLDGFGGFFSETGPFGLRRGQVGLAEMAALVRWAQGPFPSEFSTAVGEGTGRRERSRLPRGGTPWAARCSPCSSRSRCSPPR